MGKNEQSETGGLNSLKHHGALLDHKAVKVS